MSGSSSVPSSDSSMTSAMSSIMQEEQASSIQNAKLSAEQQMESNNANAFEQAISDWGSVKPQ